MFVCRLMTTKRVPDMCKMAWIGSTDERTAETVVARPKAIPSAGVIERRFGIRTMLVALVPRDTKERSASSF